MSKDDPVQIYDGRVPAIKPFQLKPINAGERINNSTQGIIQCHRIVLPDGKEEEEDLTKLPEKENRNLYLNCQEKYKIKKGKAIYIDEDQKYLYTVISGSGSHCVFGVLCKYTESLSKEYKEDEDSNDEENSDSEEDTKTEQKIPDKKESSDSKKDTKTEKEPEKKTNAVKPVSEFAVSIKIAQEGYGAVDPDPIISHVIIPPARPEGTSGEKHGGHLTAWVAFTSEIAQAIHPGMKTTTAIEKMKALAINFFSLPGHLRSGYLFGVYEDLYTKTSEKLKQLISIVDIAETNRTRYLQDLVMAYLEARNAVPLTAVATKDNKGKGESNINDRLWEFEKDKAIPQGVKLSAPAYACGLLWCLFDAESATEYAEVDSKKPSGNFIALTPQSKAPKKKVVDDFDIENMETWTSYQRRMVGAIAQHIITMKNAYPGASGTADLGSVGSLALLYKYFEDSQEFKNTLGIKSKSGWELDLDIDSSKLNPMINIMASVAAANNPLVKDK
ncbi:hypothetical protein GCM10022209_58840 [Chitinophaga oryziterrae]